MECMVRKYHKKKKLKDFISVIFRGLHALISFAAQVVGESQPLPQCLSRQQPFSQVLGQEAMASPDLVKMVRQIVIFHHRDTIASWHPEL